MSQDSRFAESTPRSHEGRGGLSLASYFRRGSVGSRLGLCLPGPSCRGEQRSSGSTATAPQRPCAVALVCVAADAEALGDLIRPLNWPLQGDTPVGSRGLARDRARKQAAGSLAPQYLADLRPGFAARGTHWIAERGSAYSPHDACGKSPGRAERRLCRLLATTGFPRMLCSFGLPAKERDGLLWVGCCAARSLVCPTFDVDRPRGRASRAAVVMGAVGSLTGRRGGGRRRPPCV